MKRAFAFVALAFSTLALAQAPKIKSGAAVYLEPGEVGTKGQETETSIEGGFENYLSAAIIKIGVPLVVITDKNKADYIIRSNAQQVLQHTRHTSWTYVSATFTVIDPRSSQVLFVGSTSQQYSLEYAAEDCAKKLKQFMKKQKE